MINRDNWKQTKIYLAYLAEVKQGEKSFQKCVELR